MSGKDAHHAVHKDDPDFVDVESKDSMLRRVDVFLDGHLMPIIQAVASTALCVAVVSHGITLSVLWRRLLQRLPPKSVTVHPEVLTKYSGIDLERIGGWSNTGYLELDITHTAVAKVASSKASSPTSLLGTPPPEVEQDISVTPTSALPSVAASTGSHVKGHADKISVPVSTSATPLLVFVGWTVTVCAVNSRQHLVDLKRTGGGVGSAHHDDKQKSIDTFFKRKKVE